MNDLTVKPLQQLCGLADGLLKSRYQIIDPAGRKTVNGKLMIPTASPAEVVNKACQIPEDMSPRLKGLRALERICTA